MNIYFAANRILLSYKKNSTVFSICSELDTLCKYDIFLSIYIFHWESEKITCSVQGI